MSNGKKERGGKEVSSLLALEYKLETLETGINKLTQIKWNVGFWGEGKTGVPRKEPLGAARWSGDVIRRTGEKRFNAVSHNRARPYFRIQHGRGKARTRRFYLNRNRWQKRNHLLSFGDGNTAGSLETTPRAANGCGNFSSHEPVSRKSRNFTGRLRVSPFPLYLKNGKDLSLQTSQSFFFLLPWKHVKISAFQNKRLAVSQMVFRDRKYSGLSRNGSLSSKLRHWRVENQQTQST